MSAHPDDPATGAVLDPVTPNDPLTRERSHLAASRSALRAMREDVEALDIKDVTANWVNAEVLARQIGERIKSLADLSHTPLFFGRLDYLHSPGADRAEGAEGERFYIGRRHVHDADGDPMVIDWRAPVSQPFYRASKTDPLDVGLRRRFGYTGGDLTAYEDEHLSDPSEAAATSKLLQQEIERPRVGPMRDIVATIQPEQDEIVRSDLMRSLCVQGAPAPARPPSACTGSPTSSTPTASASPAPAPSSSGRTARSSTTSSRSSPRSASWRSSRRPSTTSSPTSRCGARTRRRPRSSRATPGWPRCSAGPYARTSPSPPSPSWSSGVHVAGAYRRTS